MRTVRNILEAKPIPVNIIDADALVIDALRMLDTVNLSYLIVKKNDRFQGLFGERDYSRNVVLKGRSSETTRVQEVMTTDLPTVHLTDTVETCMNRMNSSKSRYLLAYDGEKFAGVITIHDLLRQVIANKEEVFDETITNDLLNNAEGGRIY